MEQLRRDGGRAPATLPGDDRQASDEGDSTDDGFDWRVVSRWILGHVGLCGAAAFVGSNLLGGEYHGHGLALVVIGFVIMLRGLGALLVTDDASEVDREEPQTESNEVAAAIDISLDGPVDAETPELAHLRGRLVERRASLPSVVELEEELREATRDLERIEALGETLRLTKEFLERAEEGVHRDIAPLLACRAAAHLKRMTAGRYDELRLDPTTLSVQVRGEGTTWRDAARLSCGTREQIYLLLRVALVDQLTVADEICPLILDDVTVHLDRERKRHVLDTLRELARDRQIVVFSQEEEVRAWAERELVEERDQLILLERAVTA